MLELGSQAICTEVACSTNGQMGIVAERGASSSQGHRASWTACRNWLGMARVICRAGQCFRTFSLRLYHIPTHRSTLFSLSLQFKACMHPPLFQSPIDSNRFLQLFLYDIINVSIDKHWQVIALIQLPIDRAPSAWDPSCLDVILDCGPIIESQSKLCKITS